jgi:hypothetical protein
MLVIRSCCCLAGLVIAVSWAGRNAAANESAPVDDSFERGAEALFAGNDAKAEPLLAAAIARDPLDPRPYYLRAICLRHEVHDDQAMSDCRVALALEISARGKYPVREWLNRLQPADRLMLEQNRWQVRTAVVTSDDTSPEVTAHHPATFEVHTDVAALRRPVSVPLDRLVRPVRLDELVANMPDETPSIASAGNPFDDDPKPATKGKIPSGKLMGILGRAIIEATPVPSVEGFRRQLPNLPGSATPEQSSSTDVEFGPGATATPEKDDPFFEPASKTAPPKDAEPKTEHPPADQIEEDPFG